MNPSPFRRLLWLAIVLCAGPALAVAVPDLCRAPEDVAGVVTSLPHVAAALKPGRRLDVLAVGSATMFGLEGSLPPGGIATQPTGPLVPQPFTRDASERAFPRQMAKELQAAVPGAEVRVTVRGGRGLLAADMLAMMRAELAARPYQLVIWQTGTVEAVRNTPPGEFAQTLSVGAEAVQAANADLVLVDAQFSRFLQTNTNMDPYEQALQQVAAMPDVLLFRRYDLMRSWVNDGQIDLERTPKADQQKMVETLHACLGVHLARLVLGAARS